MTVLTFLLLIIPGSQHHAIRIRDCDGRWVALYTDKEGTIPMANPVYSDNNGRIAVWLIKPSCLAITEDK